jgi:hypothetical protein
MFEDGTWQWEIGEKDQIIALTTKLTEMQIIFEQQVALFATQAAKIKDNKKDPDPKTEPRCSKKEPYTVAAWCLIKKEDKVIVNSKDYFWSTGNHRSGGEKHNGIYADHKSADHDNWRKTIDDHHTAALNPGKSTNETPAPISSESSKKLALNDKLWNAFCTQARLSAEAVDHIREDAQGNK